MNLNKCLINLYILDYQIVVIDKKIWKTFIRKKIGKEYDLDYDILAKMSMYFSTESIIATIDYTLSKHRLERLKYNSLHAHEFVSALSKTNYLYKEDFDTNREFLNKASG